MVWAVLVGDLCDESQGFLLFDADSFVLFKNPAGNVRIRKALKATCMGMTLAL